MILLDTNVLIYASDPGAKLYRWARRTIAAHVGGDGAAVSAVSIAEICVGDAAPDTVAERIRSWGVAVLDVPAATTVVCARAYAAYRRRRQVESGKDAARMPLPDFFIGAHAQCLGWALATADVDRFKTYFPKVRLITP